MSNRRVFTDACIYCGSTQPRRSREHVIPKSLGTFENNWVLTCVCHECTQYFSRELELVLARDSPEGYLRLQHGLRPPVATANLLNTRVRMKVTEEGPYKGANVVLGASRTGEELEPLLVPQVGFRAPVERDLTWILEEDLTSEAVQGYSGPGVDIRLVGRGDGVLPRLVARLQGIGINFTQQGTFEEPITNARNSVEIETEFRLDAVNLRAVAKVAFNYAAKIISPEFMRQPDCEPVARFIRAGEVPTDGLPVSIGRTPVLVGDRDRQQTRGHICTVGWANRDEQFSLVSLFNELTYRVTLKRRHSGIWRDLAYGHVIDPFDRSITRLMRLPGRQVPPWLRP